MTNPFGENGDGVPRLIVTIDTEEEGLWSGNYEAEATVENIRSIPRFQDLCNRYSIQPTYLITTPVAQSDHSIDVLRPIQDEGRCEIGTHVHPWNSPPLDSETSGKKDSFLCNLNPEVQHAKLKQLTELIEENFGRRPISFRAGRYGIGSSALKSLCELGYKVDSSVLPLADYRHQNGPDFRHANCMPYFPLDLNVQSKDRLEGLLEIPVTSGFTHRHFGLADRLRRIAMAPPLRRFRAVGALDRLGIATKVKLSPEQASLNQMKQLATAVTRRRVPTLVLMFHSSSLMPGASPYVGSEQELDKFLGRLEGFFQFALADLGAIPITLGAAYEHRKRDATMPPSRTGMPPQVDTAL